MHYKTAIISMTFCFCFITSAQALICPDPKRIIKYNSQWIVLGDPNWKETPFVSSEGKNPRFGGATWNDGWQPADLIERPDCFYWLNDDFEEHVEFIYRYKTINPRQCNPQLWKEVGGLSKGVKCISENRSECHFPINRC